MGLLDVVRSGIAVANSLTADLQATVTHEAFIHQLGDGTRIYAAAVSRPALVTKEQKLIKSASGEIVLSQTQVVFLDPSVLISTLDKLTMPDGSTSPILSIGGFIDKGTGQPVLTEVALG